MMSAGALCQLDPTCLVAEGDAGCEAAWVLGFSYSWVIHSEMEDSEKSRESRRGAVSPVLARIGSELASWDKSCLVMCRLQRW